jgi:murein hydrolase activator
MPNLRQSRTHIPGVTAKIGLATPGVLRPNARHYGIGFALLLSGASHGAIAAGPAASPEEARQKLEMRRSELDATKERAKFLQGDIAEIKQEREKLTSKLQDTAALIQKSEGRLTGIETKLAEMEKQEGAMRADLSQNRERIAKLMAALQRMGRNPPPVLFTQRTDALQMVRSAMLLAFAFPELRNDALALAGKLNGLIKVTDDIRAERDGLKSETARLADARVRMTALMEAKKQSIAERQSELEQVRNAAAEITKSVTDLNEMIAKLDAAVKSKTGLGAYDAETSAAAAPSTQAAIDTQPLAPKASPPAGIARETVVAALPPPAKPAKPSVIELAPASATMGAASPGRLKPAFPFHEAKARLPQPAQGRQVLAFGDKTQYGGQSKGIVIETRHGAQVTAPCDGWIVYAGEFRSYGQLLIINAGGGYHVLLAGLSQIDVQPGQFVLAAEPVGIMSGSSVTAQAKAQTNQPVLYIEFRKDSRPIDPDPWWAGSHQKVQG